MATSKCLVTNILPKYLCLTEERTSDLEVSFLGEISLQTLTAKHFQFNSIQVYFYSALHDANHCNAALPKIKVSTLYLLVAYQL